MQYFIVSDKAKIKMKNDGFGYMLLTSGANEMASTQEILAEISAEQGNFNRVILDSHINILCCWLIIGCQRVALVDHRIPTGRPLLGDTRVLENSVLI